MEFSKFTVSYEKDNNIVLFNTLNKQMKIIPRQLNLNAVKESEILQRHLSDFLVKNNEEDEKKLQYLINSMVYQSTRLNITLMMTMKCNFRCIYCFESWIPGEERCKELENFKNQVEEEKKDNLIDSFYMLSDEDKKDVKENKTNYSLEDIEAKLSVICVRKKVNFDLEDTSKNDD